MNPTKLSTVSHARFLLAALLILGCGGPSGQAAELVTRNFAVELSATLADNPPEITLHWRGDQYARSYTIHRKKLHEKNWMQIGAAEGPATSFIDRNITVGQTYEYQVIREGSLGYTGYGFIYSGINAPLVEYRGRVILAVEQSAAEALPTELKRFEFDLIGDGWQVVRLAVNRNEKPPEVKARIKSLYDLAPQSTVALLLFGNVPVPYSGNITPDEHENHRGAWPADLYYADLDGQWTDQTVSSLQAERTRNHNVPADGKFDQSELPSPVELQVGRVDLSNMTCFLNKSPSQNEIDLLRRYLEKNYRFRHREFVPRQKAMIFDRIGVRQPEALAATAWRNFAPFVGQEIEAIDVGEYFPNAMIHSYLWSAVAAGGSYSYADSVGSADAFALHPVNVVFATYVGSYYGDWDVESNFLRASLGAKGALLAASYGGKPQWLFHPMALGETIGAATKITQENGMFRTYAPFAPGTGEVHVSLLGDPTLRAHPVDPVRNLQGRVEGSNLVLNWEASPAEGLAGYYVYVAQNPAGPYQRVTDVLVTGTGTAIANYRPGSSVMVRAIALTRSPSGTYYNASQGLFYPDPFGANLSQPPAAPDNLTISKVAPAAITITWIGNSVSTSSYIIERQGPGESSFRELGRASSGADTYTDHAIASPGTYSYRIAAENSAGRSAYSNIAAGNNQSARATFLGTDRTTQGNWLGRYGSEGYAIPALEERMPGYSSMTLSNVLLYRPVLSNDLRGPQLTTRTDGLRSANCWLNGFPFTFELGFPDDLPRQVALYTMAWGKLDPTYTIQVFDSVSGTLLDEQTISDVNEGAYLVYTIQRQVQFRVLPPKGHQIEFYGIFVDSLSAAPVRIEPPGGGFSGNVLVQLSSATEGAEIYYTLDGGEPTTASLPYLEPFWIAPTARVRARAFLNGKAGITTDALFAPKPFDTVGFLRWDDQTSGSWVGVFGQEGYLLARGAQAQPPFGSVAVKEATEWTWNQTTSDARALFADTSGQVRRADAWYTGNSMSVDLAVTDGRVHTVAFYFVDFDRQGREQLLEVINSNQLVVESRLLTNFQEGRYLLLNLNGAATLRITRKKGGNAVLSGIFFDPAPGPISDPRPMRIRHGNMAGASLSLEVEGEPGSSVCLDRSDNLRDWTCVATNLFDVEVKRLLHESNGEQGRFFRTHYIP